MYQWCPLHPNSIPAADHAFPDSTPAGDFLAQAERMPQAASAGATGTSAPTEERYRMFKGLYGLDSGKIIVKILGGSTAELTVDEFKRIDPAEGMNVCLIMIDYAIFRSVMTKAFLAAFGDDTMARLFERLIFDTAGIEYGPLEELSDEQKSWLKLVLDEFKEESKDMGNILHEKARACLNGEVAGSDQIGVGRSEPVRYRARVRSDGGKGESGVRESATAGRVGP